MGKKILIVDDEKDILMILEKRLVKSGYTVFQAENGQEAIVLAKTHKPDLIVLDVVMPGIDGGEVADTLKADPQTKDIPIIFLTCLVTQGEEEERRIISGRYFVSKPYDPDELLLIIKNLQT